MKSYKEFFFSFLISFTLLFAFQINAQTHPNFQSPISVPADLDVGTISSGETMVTTLSEAVLFYNPVTSGPSITLNASLDDGTGNTFTSYEWNSVLGDGTETLVTGTTTAILTASGLAPGYHKYRVYGLVDNGDGTVTCQSDDYQDIILFVLPELSVTTTANLNGNPAGYCVAEIPTTPINLSVSGLSADYTANTNGYVNPTAEDFTLNYKWYAVLDGGTANPIDLATTTNNYDVTITQPGTYTFYVEATYAVKVDDSAREYVVFTDVVEDGTGVPLEIEVTPIPGAPTITIGGVTE